VQPREVIGRYALFDAIAAGGMATVYYGRLLGPAGFSRTVAIKKLHPQFSRDPEFVSMLVDEARLMARIRHPNVVPVLDVLKVGRELYVVMEYVLGLSLVELLKILYRQRERMPPAVAASIASGCLLGLHAAHEMKGDRGDLLGIVHRDVSPGNVLVGRDGLPRVLDFGIAKAAGRAQTTRHGEVKGKVGYMSPEQLRGAQVSRHADIYAVAIVLWEMLCGRRAYPGEAQQVLEQRLEEPELPPPSAADPELAPFDAVVKRGLMRAPGERWESARAMAQELARVTAVATGPEVAEWVERIGADLVLEREQLVAIIEGSASADDIRAAIRDDLAIEEPSISVSTWSGSSVELEQVLAAERELHTPANAHDTTTRDALGAARDSTPTLIDSVAQRRGRIDETTPAFELRRLPAAEPEPPPAAEPVPSDEGSGATPLWTRMPDSWTGVVRPDVPSDSPTLVRTAPAAQEPTSVSVSLDQVRRAPRSGRAGTMLLALGAGAAVLVGGLAALVLRSEPATPPPAVMTEPPPEPREPIAAPDEPTVPVPPAEPATTPSSEPSARVRGAPPLAPQASAAPTASATAEASASAAVEPPPPKRPGTPFDELGGRH
jgi:eukaryotic-like serine/threonine-protein kinase